jgi:hypothetical protein
MAALSSMLRTVGLESGPPSVAVPQTLPGLLDHLSRQAASDRDLQLGAVGNYAVEQVVATSCSHPSVASRLVHACSVSNQPQALVELRKRLVLDIAALLRRQLRQPMRASQLPAPVRDGLRVASSVLDALTESAQLYHLAQRMVRDTAIDARGFLQSPCATRDEPLRVRTASIPTEPRTGDPSLVAMALPPVMAQPPSIPFTTDPLAVAGLLMLRILQDGPEMRQPDAFYVQALESELGAVYGQPGFRLDLGRRQFAAQLVANIRQALGAQRELARAPDRATALSMLGQVFAQTAVSAVSVVVGQTLGVPPELRLLVDAVLGAKPGTAWTLAVSMLRQTGLDDPLPSAASEAIDCACRLADVRSEQQLRTKLVSCLAPIPWAEPWLLDVNLGALKAEQDDLRFAGDLTVGYNGDVWGMVGWGLVKAYRFQASEWAWSVTQNYEAALDGWGLVELDDTWKLELRGSARGSFYNTTIDSQVRSLYQDLDETSWMFRALASPGIRCQPGLRFAVGLWTGLGVQMETYSRSDVRSRADQAYVQETTPSLILDGRLRMQVQLLPLVVATRARLDVRQVRIRRESLSFVVAPGAISQGVAVKESTQTELVARWYLDAEAARFGGFVPGAYVGLDYVSLSASGEPTYSAVVPAFGAGIRRDVF